MRDKSRLRIYVSAGCAAIIAVLVFMTGCKPLGDTGTEDEKKQYMPAAIPLSSLTVEDEAGFDYVRGFQPDRLDYEIFFNREQIGTPVVVKATAADQAEVVVSIGRTIAGKDQLSTKFPEDSVRVDIKVTEKTGRVSTNYQVLLVLDELAFSPDISGSVTINGNFDKDGLQAVLSPNCNVLSSKAVFTWYRNDVKVNSNEGTAGMAYAVSDADNNAVIKVEITSDEKGGKLAATRRAPRWESAEVVKDLITQVEELLAQNISSTVVGDPKENPHEYASVLDLIEQLNTLMKGVEYEEEVDNTTGGKTIEKFTKYDYSQIADKTEELKKLLDEGFSNMNISEIIANELVFNYTGAEQTVKTMDKKDALYEIELIGASGGPIYASSPNSKEHGTESGGKGAHVVAQYKLAKGSLYTMRLGGEGAGTAVWDEKNEKYNKVAADYEKPKAGGWPNGGTGGGVTTSTSYGYPAGSGGGGSTDIRLKTATGAFDGSSSDPRFMVAAGGSGAAQRRHVWSATGGANADADGIIFDDGKAVTDSAKKPKAGGSSDEKGQNGVNYEHGLGEAASGGGGGYKGGAAVTIRNYNNLKNVTGSGAGGSSYVKQDSSYINNSKTIAVTSASGNGSARIKWVGYPTN